MIPLNAPFNSNRPFHVHEKDVERFVSMGYTRVEEPASEPQPTPKPRRTRRTTKE